jgi:ketosteroid isomerase-like protein
MDPAEAQAFARQWVKDWNAHDVDSLLKHFTDDVVFTSPVAVRIFGGDGVIRGKEALRNYWSEGVRLNQGLHFEVLALYVGISTLVINYRNQAGGVASEVLTFVGCLVKEGHGTVLAQAPVGLKQRSCGFDGEERAGPGRLRVATRLIPPDWSALRHAA